MNTSKFAPYRDSLRSFRSLCGVLGVKSPIWTLHSARNWFPTCANQLVWDLDGRRQIGRWAAKSQMSERYGRAVCAAELRLRDSILRKIESDEWRTTEAFGVPDSAAQPAPQPSVCDPAGGAQPGSHASVCDPKSATPLLDKVEVPGTQSESAGDVSEPSSSALDELSEVDISDLYPLGAFF